MKARIVMPLVLFISCCLPQLPAQSNSSKTTQSAAELRQWVFAERKLAIKGNVDAQESLGAFYYYGIGVPQDYARAAVWFHRAAIQGDSGVQGMLGDLYLQGEGVPQDYSQAYFWLDLATAGQLPRILPLGPKTEELEKNLQQKSKQALISDRDEAASRLTRAELLQVQERARKWFESHAGEDGR